jgi:hypothetical protein
MVSALGVVGGTPGWAVRGIIPIRLHARYINYYIMMKRKRNNLRNLSFFLRLLYMSVTYTQIAARVARFARLRRARTAPRPASLFFPVGPHCVSWNQENGTQGPLAYHRCYTRYENLPGLSNNQKKKENPNLVQSSGTLRS